MRVPFVDLARENVALLPELLEATERVARSGRVLYGAELEAFEHEIAEWHGVKYAVGVASGTDAVEIALRATAVDDGTRDTAHVTAFTAAPTINAMDAADTAVFLVDVDPVTRNAAGCSLQVHLYGLAEDADGADVEDVAHSMGAMVNGRLAGAMGLCGALSFYPSKIMGALGDGGAIVTDEYSIADKARQIRHYGFNDDRTDIALRGQNSRLCELQAAYLRVKLPHVHGWINRRREIAALYNAELAGRLEVPTEPEGSKHVYHVWVALTDDRDRLQVALAERGISTMRHYDKAIHQYKRWKHLGEAGQFPVAERLAATVLSLPCYPYMRDDEVDAVISAVKEST